MEDKWNKWVSVDAKDIKWDAYGGGGSERDSSHVEEEEDAILDYRSRSKLLFICLVTTVLIAIAYTSVILTHDPGEL